GIAIALLVRTSEPIDWRRTALEVQRAAPQPLLPVPPGGPRLIAATFASGTPPTPNEESATVLLGDAADLSGWRVERRVVQGPAPGGGTGEPGWETWYVFDGETRGAGGRRFRVFAGREADAVPGGSGAGEERRFGGAAASGFSPGFPAQGVDLRLVAPDGRPGHLRRFLPDSAYAPAEAPVLRAAGGTGVVPC